MSAVQGQPELFILLATYRGERFLPGLLASLQAQTDMAWRLVVSDDGSDDGSLQMLESFARSNSRVEILERRSQRLGATGNFAALLEHFLAAGGQWFALCDQDDIWMPGKVEHVRAALAQAGRRQSPCLVYSDLSWIDDDGKLLAHSHFACAGLGSASLAANPQALIHNLIPGCAMAGDRNLVQRAMPFPAAVRHHDWWLLLVAAACGHVVALGEVLVKYRQHDDNLIGAATRWRRVLHLLSRPVFMLRHARDQYWTALAQAEALAERLGIEQVHPAWQEALWGAKQQLSSRARLQRTRALMSGVARRRGFAGIFFMLLGAWQSKRDSTGGHLE